MADASDDRVLLAGRVQLWLTAVTVGANLVGAAVVVVLIVGVVPTPADAELRSINLVLVPAYIAGALVVGAVWGTRRLLPRLDWVRTGEPPDRDQQRIALRAPVDILVVEVVLWGAAVVLFTVVNGVADRGLILPVAFTVGGGATSTCATAYLLAERALRPIAALALSQDPPDKPLVPGVAARSVLAWLLGSAVPVGGLGLVAAFALAQGDVSADRLAGTILGLGGVTLVVGGLTTVLAARATASAVGSVRRALASVQDGDLAVRTAVFDGTEVGLLQAGFNRMAEGLEERERIRDLFGRHVGDSVARSAIAGHVELGGEVRDVGVLFVDIVGSTALAATTDPREVVTLLNRFFDVVVDVVDHHGGIVNKFEGDAALAIFGAPTEVDDAAGRALGAARAMATQLAAAVPELRAGIGVSHGAAVAGNVGGRRRYEYTVIGDPVNEAARLTELAKTIPGGVVAASVAVDAARPEERGRWQAGDELTLRGRMAPTRLYRPLT
jgi:adenylate cyclase